MLSLDYRDMTEWKLRDPILYYSPDFAQMHNVRFVLGTIAILSGAYFFCIGVLTTRYHCWTIFFLGLSHFIISSSAWFAYRQYSWHAARKWEKTLAYLETLVPVEIPFLGAIFDQSLRVNLHILYSDNSGSIRFGKQTKRIRMQKQIYKLYVEPHEHDRFLMELMK